MSIQFPKNILVTGGAGFIGSAFIRYGIDLVGKIVNLDSLTYASNLEALSALKDDPRYLLSVGDICDEALVFSLCVEHKIDAIVHFAAESHVDRSILGPEGFIKTNVMGTFHLLEVVRKLPHIHFHHISTDEVYGSLDAEGLFNEESCLRPNSPYSASKAASDCFVRSYAHTYNLSTTISHCSNNFGPYQNEEKFIPNMIMSCLNKKPLTVYGRGMNVRDWIYVDDHVEAIWLILQKGKRGQVYDIGGACEMKNIDLLHLIISELSKITGENYSSLITFVGDRPGHDFRYAIDTAKIKKELGWSPRHNLISGLQKTLNFYLAQRALTLN